MVVSTTSTVRAHAKGMARRHFSLALFAGVAALPLLTMGITVPSAVAKSRAVSERDAMRARLEERESIVRALREYESEGDIEDLEELHRSLVGMIPSSIEPLDEFGALRAAAKALDVELVSVKPVRTHTVGVTVGASQSTAETLAGGPSPAAPAQPRSVVQVDEVLVHLREPVDKIFGLVQELRRRGLPTLMLSFDLSRENPAQRTFEAEVRFGFVRRAALHSSGGTSPR